MLHQLVLANGGTCPLPSWKSQAASIPVTSLLLTSLVAMPARAAEGDALSLITEKLLLAKGFLLSLLVTAYAQQPALVLVLAALLAVPALAILSLSTQSLVRFVAWRRRLPATARTTTLAVRDTTPHTGVPAWPAQAWLKVEAGDLTVPISAEIVSIGRHEDNVVHLTDKSVHRFHAIIHRNDDAHFVITDVSGEEGNGVRINGELMARAHLADGDRIELGRARLTFASVPH